MGDRVQSSGIRFRGYFILLSQVFLIPLRATMRCLSPPIAVDFSVILVTGKKYQSEIVICKMPSSYFVIR